MIISHKHKYIFLHVPKTGGSSISISLMRSLGSKDICIGGVHDAAAMGIYPPFLRLLCGDGKSMFVFMKQFAKTGSVGKALPYTIKRYYSGLGLKGHSTWQDVKQYIGERKWNTYYKFAFERNPYDKMVSHYIWWRKRYGGTQRFKDFLLDFEKSYNIFSGDSIITAEREPRLIYSDASNGVQVDDVGRFENIQEDLGRIMRRAGVKWDGWLPKSKSSQRKESYKDYYDDESLVLIRRIFGWEIGHFGYEYLQ